MLFFIGASVVRERVLLHLKTPRPEITITKDRASERLARGHNQARWSQAPGSSLAGTQEATRGHPEGSEVGTPGCLSGAPFLLGRVGGAASCGIKAEQGGGGERWVERKGRQRTGSPLGATITPVQKVGRLVQGRGFPD